MKNMKIKKLVATALTVASVAAMTAIPAFAANSTSASTSINFTTEASDVKVIVPTSYNIILNKDGSSTSPSNFTITNKSDFNIKPREVKFESKSDWKIANRDLNAGNNKNKLDSKEVNFSIGNNGGSYSHGDNYEILGLDDSATIKPNTSSKLDIKVSHAILYKDNESNIYVSEYNYGENMERPPIGSKPTRYKLDKGQRKNIEDFLSKVSKERIFNEKYKNKDEINVTLAIISMYSDLSENSVYNSYDNNTRWCGINLSNLIPVKYEKNSTKISNNYKSPMYITVHDSGYGYPSDWLKKDNYKDIMYNAGYNMDDEFWTRHNIDEKKFYTRKNDNGETETLTVTLDQINRFYINIDGNPCYFNEENLNNYLSMEGWQ